VPAYGFNASDARRIGDLIRAAEHGRVGRVGLGADAHDASKPGVRLLIAKHDGGSWPTDSTAVVTIYNGDQGNLASAATVVAYNQYVRFGSDPVCTSRWVSLGHNGFSWIPVDSQDACDNCDSEIGGIDFSVFPGFAKTSTQILGHDGGGCIKWYDIFTCSTAAS
jgi:hypothetical protein